jgi:predicted unusual protein kinase regulating ubiquinone biosynthesis (AarF/ABC1/UbiB family)
MAPKSTTGRFERALALARVGARTGLSITTSLGNEAAATQALKVLGELRGIATKIGQTLSYVDGVIPEKHRATYEATLQRLQSAVPTSPPLEVRATVEREFGAPLKQLFTEWSPEPVASASIGQVHRARLLDGRQCAVKVQHSDVERAIESDLANLTGLLPLLGWALPGDLDPTELLNEVSARFREELDYTHEAHNTEAFRLFWADDPHVVIPAVIPSHSGRRVLTTEWVEGATLDQAALMPELDRRQYAEHMWRFVFRSLLVGGAFNADPHPGNYFFQPDGKIVFLDFGCVQLVPDVSRLAAARAHQGAVARNQQTFRNNITELMQMRDGGFRDATLEYIELCFKPLFESPFHISRPWVAQLTKAVQSSKSTMLKRGSNITLPPPHMAMMNRLQFGFYSVLARLDVTVDYAALEVRFLDEAHNIAKGTMREHISNGASAGVSSAPLDDS